MSADFKTALIKDSRIAGITDQLTYAVMSGGSSVNYQSFPAISPNATSITFNVNVPSENTIVSREVLIKTKINFTLEITGVTAGEYAIDLGHGKDALAPFPLNQLFQTATAQINNTSVSVNSQDVLPCILAMTSQEELSKYNGMTPHLLDNYYANYVNAVGNINNPLNSYGTSNSDNSYVGRGSHRITIVAVNRKEGNNNTKTLVSQADTDVFTIGLQVEVCEPIFCLSPFLYGSPEFNSQGLVGIQNINFTFNIDSTFKRFFGSGQEWTLTSIKGGINVPTDNAKNTASVFPNCEMLMNFISSQPEDRINARNVVPYLDLPRYITNISSTIEHTGSPTTQLTANNITLNQLPDYFIICVRKRIQDFTHNEATHFLAIDDITINLNNVSGLLSSASVDDLYRMSRKNGSQQSYENFIGVGQTQLTSATANGGKTDVPTIGSVLVLSPAMDLSLPSYLSNGSLGSYNLSFSIGVKNHSGADITSCEIVVICANSGLLTTIAGSSSLYTGILTKQMVIDAKAMGQLDPIQSSQYVRLVGGNMNEKMMSNVKEMPMTKEYDKVMYAKMKGFGASSGGGVSSGGRFGHMTTRR